MPGRKFSSISGYRYGFNGQENSDEIAAGLTTAMYWEYDSRIGKRWNVDPVYKIYQSNYTTFSNNPISKSDLNGNDDYFMIDSKTGKVVLKMQDNKGNLIKIWDGAQYVLLSQIKIETEKKNCICSGIADIINFYSLQVGVKNNFVSNDDDEDEFSGTIGVADFSKIDAESKTARAGTDKNKNIWLNVFTGYISNDFDNYQNLKNAIIHEDNHRNNDVLTFGDHLKTYVAQIGHESFKNTTQSFQVDIISLAYTYLMNANNKSTDSKENINKLQKQLDQILQKQFLVVKIKIDKNDKMTGFTIHNTSLLNYYQGPFSDGNSELNYEFTDI